MPSTTQVKLTIDGREVEIAAGQTILAATRELGLDIPTLCHLDGCAPATSCLACLVLVRSNGQARLVPACATKVQPGLVVESETPEVHEARRTALELLLSDHCGDCLSPCHRICPLHLNIPVMIRQIEAGRLEEAIVTVRDALPLPAVLGRICHHPCENGCRRGTWDEPAAIREMERHVADTDMQSSRSHLPACAPPTGKSVVIVGSGPAGLAAADYLVRAGHACTVVDRHAHAGGSLRTGVDEQTLPRDVLNWEIAQLERLGVQFKLGVELGSVVTLEGLQRGFDVILLTLGELAKGEGRELGLAFTPAGLQVDPATHQTSLRHVFAAGSAVKPAKQVVRAMSEGQSAAACIHQFLSGAKMQRREKEFSSMMGRLENGEIDLFMKDASATPRTCAGCGSAAGFTGPEAATEAKRCLHCDCRAVGHCRLQYYAAIYGADPNRFRAQRRPFELHHQPGSVIFEPGKCILCGICVQITEQAREPLGLTFIGRGFDVRVGTPFNGTISEGLQKVAALCARYCPTGAISLKEEKPAGSVPGAGLK